MKQSKFLSLGWRDLLRALVVSLLAVIVQFLQETFIPALNIPVELKTMLIMAIAYLSKNFATKPDQLNVFADGDIGGGGIKNPPVKQQ